MTVAAKALPNKGDSDGEPLRFDVGLGVGVGVGVEVGVPPF